MAIRLRRHTPLAALAITTGMLLPLALLSAQPAAGPPAPKVAFVLKDRHGHATPERVGSTHTGGGNTDVAQPSDDKLIITMTGVAVAGDGTAQVIYAIGGMNDGPPSTDHVFTYNSAINNWSSALPLPGGPRRNPLRLTPNIKL